MGFYQERIITQPYKLQNKATKEFFKDAQFLVFANRLVALILAGIYILFRWKSLPVHVPPLYLHSFTSFSNVLSSWCQYEALKYVSFPTQTVCKASKLVPTMIMGRIVRKRQYSIREYILAFIIVFGASIFFLSSTNQIKRESNDKRREEINSAISGFILMCGYLLLDAFTPNWQKSN
uniref:Adenosine 3'-phospho 5'-phosphosulfate transporter 1 n=1 Tax=Meloidogyne javanica TaxID=6303 RepID=A0A915M982_MELJA